MAVSRRTSFAFPRQWNPTQVPNFPVEIDGNKAPRGLILSTTGNSHGRDLTGNYAGIATGSTAVAATPAGVGLTSVSGGVVGYAIPPPLIFSIETYVQAGSALAGGEAVCGWNQSSDGSSGTTDRQILGTGVNHYNFNIFPSGGCISASASFNDNIVTHIVGVVDGVNSYIYINGVLSNTLAGGSAYTGYTLPAYFVIGNAGSNPWSGKIMLANVATAAWTASEVAQRAAAPFAMFRPPVRRTYFVAPAGGAFSASLSDSITTSDALSSVFAAVASQSDTAATSTSFTSSGVATASLSDTAATSDALSAGGFLATVSDTAATSTTLTAIATITASLTDTATTSDAITTANAYTATVSDTAATSDAFTTPNSLVATLTDTLATSSAFTGSAAFSVSISDSAATFDAVLVANNYIASLFDTLTTSDAFAILAPAVKVTLPIGRPVAQEYMPDEAAHRRQIARTVNLAMAGKTNTSIFVTLTPNVSVTPVVDARISMQTCVTLHPQTANAAAALSTTYTICTAGLATINHQNSAQNDRTFTMGISG